MGKVKPYQWAFRKYALLVCEKTGGVTARDLVGRYCDAGGKYMPSISGVASQLKMSQWFESCEMDRGQHNTSTVWRLTDEGLDAVDDVRKSLPKNSRIRYPM